MDGALSPSLPVSIRTAQTHDATRSRKAVKLLSVVLQSGISRTILWITGCHFVEHNRFALHCLNRKFLECHSGPAITICKILTPKRQSVMTMTRVRNRKAEPYSGLSHRKTPCYLVKVGSKSLGHASKVRRCHGGPRLAGLRGFPEGGGYFRIMPW